MQLIDTKEMECGCEEYRVWQQIGPMQYNTYFINMSSLGRKGWCVTRRERQLETKAFIEYWNYNYPPIKHR
jgi:hypothetical protein